MSGPQRSLGWMTSFCLVTLLGTAAIGAYSRYSTVPVEDRLQPVATPPVEPDVVAVADPQPRAEASDGAAAAVGVDPRGDVAAEPLLVQHVGGIERPWYTPLTEDGFLPVRVFTLAGGDDWKMVRDAAVVVSRDGTVVGVGKAEAGGIAQIPGLGAGLHSILAFSAQGIAAVGVYVSSEPGEFQPGRSMTVDVPLVPAVDVPLVAELLHAAGSVRSAGAGAIVPAEELGGFDRGGEPVFVKGPDGVLQGRMVTFDADHVRALSSADVFFIQQGALQARTRTDVSGRFTLPAGPLSAGPASLVVVGAGGYAVASATIVETADRLTRAVAFQGAPGPTFLGTAEPESLSQFLQQIQAAVGSPPGTPPPAGGGGGFAAGPGGTGGGFGGGGGGLGAGGSLLPALLGAGLGAAAMGLIDDNDNGREVISPATP